MSGTPDQASPPSRLTSLFNAGSAKSLFKAMIGLLIVVCIITIITAFYVIFAHTDTFLIVLAAIQGIVSAITLGVIAYGFYKLGSLDSIAEAVALNIASRPTVDRSGFVPPMSTPVRDPYVFSSLPSEQPLSPRSSALRSSAF